MTEKLNLETLMQNLSYLGKHDVTSVTMIVDPDNLSGVWFKIYGPNDKGAILSCIMKCIVDEACDAKLSDKAIKAITDTVHEQCQKYLNGIKQKSDSANIKSKHTSELLDTEIGNIILTAIENDEKEMHEIGFDVLTTFHISDKRSKHIVYGNIARLLVLLSSSLSQVFNVVKATPEDVASLKTFIENELS